MPNKNSGSDRRAPKTRTSSAAAKSTKSTAKATTAKSTTKTAAHETAPKHAAADKTPCQCGGHSEHDGHSACRRERPAKKSPEMTQQRWTYLAVTCFIVAGLTAIYVLAGLVNGQQPASATQPTAAPPTAPSNPSAAGEQASTGDPASALISQKCGGSCHQPSQLLGAAPDKAAAAAAVDKMVRAGRVSLTAQERESIVAALSQR